MEVVIPREIAEQHKGLVEHALQHVAALPVGVLGGICAQHVVVHDQVRETKALRRLNIVTDRRRVSADLGLRKYNACFHYLLQ